MSEVGFISLPFQPMKSMRTPFYFSTAIMGEYLASLFDGRYYLGVNSLHSFKSYSEEEYLEFEKKFDFINKKILYYDRDYIDNISQIIEELYDSKDIRIFSELTAICECGRVEMTQSEIERFHEINMGMQLVEERNGELVCKHCQKKLVFQNKESLFLCFKEKELSKAMNVHPLYLNSDLNHFRKSLLDSHLRISRGRDTGVTVEVHNQSFYLDIDMLWKFIPLCLHEQKVVVVSSVKHLFSLFLINYVSKIMGKENVYFVGLPFIQTSEIGEDVLRFYNDEQHRKALKLLVALGVGWSKKSICLQESTCKYFMSSKTKNDELTEYVYGKIFEENDWKMMSKKISLYTQLQSVLQIKKRESNNKKI